MQAFFQRALVAATMRWVVNACGLLTIVGTVFSFTLIEGEPGWHWVILLLAPLWYLLVAIHEGGHLIGARLSGMLVREARVGPVVLRRGRGFVKVSFGAPRFRPDTAGYLMATPDLSRPLLPQLVLTGVGGPLANLIAGGICLSVSMTVPERHAAAIFFGAAVANLGLGIANLLPSARHANDGFQLLGFVPVPPADDPRMTGWRLLWFSHRGTTAENLPPADVDALQHHPQPAPLMRLWIKMEAAQNTGAWRDAIALADEFECVAASLPPALMRALQGDPEFAQVRLERAFSQAMAAREPVSLDAAQFSTRGAGDSPVGARCLALNAALAGNGADCEHWLSRCVRLADASPDLATSVRESALCDAVRALLPA